MPELLSLIKLSTSPTKHLNLALQVNGRQMTQDNETKVAQGVLRPVRGQWLPHNISGP